MKIIPVYTKRALVPDVALYKKLMLDFAIAEEKYGYGSIEAFDASMEVGNAYIIGSRNTYPDHTVAILHRDTNKLEVVNVTMDNLKDVRRKIQNDVKYFVTHKVDKMIELFQPETTAQ